MHTVVLHLLNEEPVMGEVEELPGMADTLITVKNPRKRDGKDLNFLDAEVTTVIWSLGRVIYIEVLPTGEEEEIISFVRE